ncbi:MAG: arginine decarboxylase, partial [Rubripirellula sp.]|nr:arginine decarboxylase [Rubripirellula sp.]
MSVAAERRWSIEDAADLYGIEHWAGDYFHISESGNLCVSPNRDPNNSIDLKRLVDQLGERGLELPVLLRFNGILADRLKNLHD